MTKRRPPGNYVCVISYVEESIEAGRRCRRGERQLYCFECGGLWRWPEQCDHEGRMTYKELRSFIAKVKKEVRRRYPTQQDRLHRELAAAIRRGAVHA